MDSVIRLIISYCVEVRERCWFPGWCLLRAKCIAKKGHFNKTAMIERETKQNEQDIYKVYTDLWTIFNTCIKDRHVRDTVTLTIAELAESAVKSFPPKPFKALNISWRKILTVTTNKSVKSVLWLSVFNKLIKTQVLR